MVRSLPTTLRVAARAGFTLIEMMISLTIVTIILLATAASLQREAESVADLQRITYSERLMQEMFSKVEQRVEDYVASADVRIRQMERIEDKLDLLEKDLSRYRGLVGGVLLAVTAIVSFFKFFWDDLTNFFGR